MCCWWLCELIGRSNLTQYVEHFVQYIPHKRPVTIIQDNAKELTEVFLLYMKKKDMQRKEKKMA